MFSLFLNLTRFNVGDFVEGKDAPNIRVYGKIVDICGSGRKVRYQVKFINGNTAELAANRMWKRTEDLNCSYFDNLEQVDSENESMASIGSKSSTGSAKSDRTSQLAIDSTPKKRYYY